MQTKSRIPQNRQMMKYDVRTRLGGRVFVCFAACMLPQLLPWLLRLLPVSFGVVTIALGDGPVYSGIGVSLSSYALSLLASTFVTNPMGVRLAGFFITFTRDPEHLPSPLTVCDCFGPDYWRLVGGMLLRTVAVAVWTAVPLAISALVPGAWTIMTIEGEQVLHMGTWAYPFLLLSLGMSTYRGLVYMWTPYILAEDSEATPREAMRESAALMRGRVLEMLVVELSFFGWILVMSFTLMIAGIYVYPYIEGTMAAYYVAFTQPQPWEVDRADAA